jgi:hypothetical protein
MEPTQPIGEDGPGDIAWSFRVRGGQADRAGHEPEERRTSQDAFWGVVFGLVVGEPDGAVGAVADEELVATGTVGTTTGSPFGVGRWRCSPRCAEEGPLWCEPSTR